MCYIWQNPTAPPEEVSLNTLAKLPTGIDNLNVSGGEPTLRKDLVDMMDVLYPKARILEISSNGLHAERLEPIVKKYPNVKIRFSLEGFEATSNAIRGEPNGFAKKLAGLRRLRELGGSDLGFAMTIQDENVEELVRLYEYVQSIGFEFATSALHNAWQFHKNDNIPYDRRRIAREVEQLIAAMLRTRSIKTWFRAYLNLGLIRKVLGQDRLIPCTAATDFVFVDPWSDVYACNVRPELRMGNLEQQNWPEIMNGPVAQRIRREVRECQQNCWMVTTARTAMRNPILPMLPKMKPLNWVVRNKLRQMAGAPVDFGVIDYADVRRDAHAPRRESFLNITHKRQLQRRSDPHYVQGVFYNR